MSLTGLRVLIVEDEPLIAMDVEQTCLDHGAKTVIVARNLTQLPPFDSFDVAILDRFIEGETTLDLARRLQAAGTPFIFSSGYTDSGELTAEFPDVSIVQKPYSSTDLVASLAASFERSRRV